MGGMPVNWCSGLLSNCQLKTRLHCHFQLFFLKTALWASKFPSTQAMIFWCEEKHVFLPMSHCNTYCSGHTNVFNAFFVQNTFDTQSCWVFTVVGLSLHHCKSCSVGKACCCQVLWDFWQQEVSQEWQELPGPRHWAGKMAGGISRVGGGGIGQRAGQGMFQEWEMVVPSDGSTHKDGIPIFLARYARCLSWIHARKMLS